MKLHWKPDEFNSLPMRDRALMNVFISKRIEAEKEEQKKIDSMKGRGLKT